jgi:hypothetical protein
VSPLIVICYLHHVSIIYHSLKNSNHYLKKNENIFLLELFYVVIDRLKVKIRGAGRAKERNPALLVSGLAGSRTIS